MTSRWLPKRAPPPSGWAACYSVPARGFRPCNDRLGVSGRLLMASGIVRKAMVYLGLTDDEYEDYDVYDDGGSGPRRYAEPVESTAGSVSAVRPLRGVAGDPSNGVTVTPRPAVVRPITPMQSAKVHVVAPAKFADAQEIGDRFKN